MQARNFSNLRNGRTEWIVVASNEFNQHRHLGGNLVRESRASWRSDTGGLHRSFLLFNKGNNGVSAFDPINARLAPSCPRTNQRSRNSNLLGRYVHQSPPSEGGTTDIGILTGFTLSRTKVPVIKVQRSIPEQ